eukprot:106886-Alexandrium_andersonii.AAC.1
MRGEGRFEVLEEHDTGPPYYPDDIIWSQRVPGGPYLPMDREEWQAAHPELASLMEPVNRAEWEAAQ